MTPAALRLTQRQIWLALGLMLASATAFAATSSAWLTRTWQTEEGLPNTYVSSVAQSQDGFLWVATPVTLARFDGVRFTRFPFRNVTESDYQGTRQNQGARKLVASRNGGLWITPIRGPAVYLSPEQSSVTTPETGLPPGTEPTTSFEDKDGTLWIAAAGMIIQLKKGGPVRFGEPEGVPRGTVYSLTMDAEGMVWLVKGGHVSGSRVMVLRNGRFEAVTLIKGPARAAASRSKGVWIASREHLFKCDAEGRLQDFGAFQPENVSTEVEVLMEDHAGAVWIGTDGNGLFRHSGVATSEAEAHASSDFEKIETSYPKILSLTEDRENNLWVATGGGGLDRISPRSVQMEGIENGGSLIGIQSICEDTKGQLWGATQNGLLVCRRDEKWCPALTNTLGRVACVAADAAGAVWIGTQDGSLHRWQNQELTSWDGTKGLLANSVVVLLPSSKGDLWLAEYIPNGVQCLHEGTLRELTSPQDTGRIYALAEDTAGTIWVATSKGLLLRAEGGQLVDETPRTAASGRAIRSLYATRDGALWLGYGGWGLGRLKDKQFAKIGTEQGLPDDYLSQMIGDDQGWLWFGSAEHGIFRIRQQQLEQAMEDHTTRLRPVLYGRNEGLLGMEVFGNSPGAIRSRDGRLWIPMRKALAVVDPKILRETPEPPQATLTRVLLDGGLLASYGGVMFTQSVTNLKTLNVPLHLQPGHRRLEIGFTALNFNAPENVHLQYQLEGVDNDWVEAESQRSASYSRLPAGDYSFRVRACNADGLWNEAAARLAIIVAPFTWQTWWFRLVAMALFTSAVIASVRYVSFRRLRMRLRVLEQQTALDKERTRIARDLHDDLGCSLTHVALVLEMNEQKATESEPTNGKVQLCSPLVRQVVKSVDEIIWAISPRNDQLQYLLDYIVEFAVEFMQAAGIRPQVDLPDSIPERLVSPEVRHSLFLVVKESLNNIARHARASEVRFRVTISGEQLGIFIEDNGRGFGDVPNDASADGLRNMRQRIDEIGGRFSIQSQPGAGTKISLLYSWPLEH